VRPARRARTLVAAVATSVCFGLSGESGRPTPPEPTPAVTPSPARPDAALEAAEANAPPTAAPSAFGPVIWRELRYAARKLIFGASTAIRIESAPARGLAGALKRPPNARPVPLPEGDVVALSMTTDLPFGRDEKVTLWLDPMSGAALGAEKTVVGGNSYHKLLRFTDGGLYTWRSAPASAREERLGPEGWTARKQYMTQPAVGPPGGTPVTDAYALLYLVSAARLDRKDTSLRLVVLADKGYAELVFASGGLSRLRASFDESWPGGTRRRDGDVLVRTVRATARAVDAAHPQDDVDLGFLGMRGALTVLVEVGSGIPVAFSGRAEHVGNLTVRLDRAALAAPPPDLHP